MEKCQKIFKFSKVDGCSILIYLIVIAFAISSRCVSAKAITFVDNENSDGLSKTENFENKVYDNLYDYYDEIFEEYTRHRVVDLDEYDLDEKSSFIIEDDFNNLNFDDYGKSDHALNSPAMEFDLSCPDLPTYQIQHNQCYAKICRSNDDCKVTSQRSMNRLACCFNGCVSTCIEVPQTNPPIAFDWIEETELTIPRTNAGKLKALPVYDDDNTTDTIVLPGGCAITLQQLEELQMFRKHDHIESCTCENGEVVCKVKMRAYAYN